MFVWTYKTFFFKYLCAGLINPFIDSECKWEISVIQQIFLFLFFRLFVYFFKLMTFTSKTRTLFSLDLFFLFIFFSVVSHHTFKHGASFYINISVDSHQIRLLSRLIFCRSLSLIILPLYCFVFLLFPTLKKRIWIILYWLSPLILFF